MGIWQRTSDILAANLNSVVDRFEDPQRMLRLAMIEIEAAVTTTATATARAIAAEQLMAKTNAWHQDQAQLWHARAATAVESNDEPLARRALARELEHRRAIAAGVHQLVAAHETTNRLRGQLERLREKHSEARARLSLLTARHTAALAQRQACSAYMAPAGSAPALARFERFYEALEMADAETAALVELDASCGDSLETLFDDRANQLAIDQELARLRERETKTTS